MTTLREQIKENQGNAIKDTDSVDEKVEGMRNDLVVFSKSFSDFLKHYESSVKETKTNYTSVSEQLTWVKNSVKDLSSTLGSSDHGVESVRSSIDSLTNTIQVLSQTDYILEERLRNAENLTEVFAKTVNGELMKMKSTLISPSYLNEAISNLTYQIETVRANADVNMTSLAFSVKALEQTMKLTLHNTTIDISDSMGEITTFVQRLHGELKLQSEAVNEDFVSFKKSIAFAKDKYDELFDLTQSFDQRMQEQASMRNNMTQEMLDAMGKMDDRLGEAEETLELVKPQIDIISSSITTFIGQVGSEISTSRPKTRRSRPRWTSSTSPCPSTR